jgi:ketol-acid reductoisomerase
MDKMMSKRITGQVLKKVKCRKPTHEPTLIIKKSKFNPEFSKNILNMQIIATLGYGHQAQSQSLNLRDNGHHVILGIEKGDNYDKAKADGWIPNKNLFSIDEAAFKGTIIHNLLSDTHRIEQWKNIKPNLHIRNTLSFSHGLAYVDKIPENIDTIMVSPEVPDILVRKNFLERKHINASYAIDQNYSNDAGNTAIALAFAIGCTDLYKTIFHKEWH